MVVYAKGNRISSLPITQYCSGAGALGAKHGAGRAAAMSSAFHAVAAKVPNAEDTLMLLTAPERATISEWYTPHDVTLEDGTVLKYLDAEHEMTVHLTETGESTDDPNEAMCTGHPDMFWIRDMEIEGETIRVAYIGDLKKTDYSTKDGLRSLALMAYGFAVAAKYNCDAFAVGLFNITEGEWDWSEVIELGFESAGTLYRIKLAAKNTDGDFATGTHCRDCWQRMHCPEYLAPVIDPEAALHPLSQPGGITKDNALQFLDIFQRAKEMVEIVEKQIKAYARDSGGIPNGEGKIWRERVSKGGKMVLNRKALVKSIEEQQPEWCKQFYHPSAEGRSSGFTWCNAKKPKKKGKAA